LFDLLVVVDLIYLAWSGHENRSESAQADRWVGGPRTAYHRIAGDDKKDRPEQG
jgi:hypothetical protein